MAKEWKCGRNEIVKDKGKKQIDEYEFLCLSGGMDGSINYRCSNDMPEEIMWVCYFLSRSRICTSSMPEPCTESNGDNFMKCEHAYGLCWEDKSSVGKQLFREKDLESIRNKDMEMVEEFIFCPFCAKRLKPCIDCSGAKEFEDVNGILCQCNCFDGSQ